MIDVERFDETATGSSETPLELAGVQAEQASLGVAPNHWHWHRQSEHGCSKAADQGAWCARIIDSYTVSSTCAISVCKECLADSSSTPAPRYAPSGFGVARPIMCSQKPPFVPTFFYISSLSRCRGSFPARIIPRGQVFRPVHLFPKQHWVGALVTLSWSFIAG